MQRENNVLNFTVLSCSSHSPMYFKGQFTYRLKLSFSVMYVMNGAKCH